MDQSKENSVSITNHGEVIHGPVGGYKHGKPQSKSLVDKDGNVTICTGIELAGGMYFGVSDGEAFHNLLKDIKEDDEKFVGDTTIVGCTGLPGNATNKYITGTGTITGCTGLPDNKQKANPPKCDCDWDCHNNDSFRRKRPACLREVTPEQLAKDQEGESCSCSLDD